MLIFSIDQVVYSDDFSSYYVGHRVAPTEGPKIHLVKSMLPGDVMGGFRERDALVTVWIPEFNPFTGYTAIWALGGDEAPVDLALVQKRYELEPTTGSAADILAEESSTDILALLRFVLGRHDGNRDEGIAYQMPERVHAAPATDEGGSE